MPKFGIPLHQRDGWQTVAQGSLDFGRHDWPRRSLRLPTSFATKRGVYHRKEPAIAPWVRAPSRLSSGSSRTIIARELGIVTSAG
jgi:hypothetical protein